MKIAFRIALLISVIFLTNYTTVSAQYTPVEKKKTTSKSKNKPTDKYFDESGDFAQHLQYGLYFSPGLQFSGNFLNFRLDPYVGYKINKFASAGITGGLDYTYIRASDGVSNASANVLGTSLGVYARITPIQSLNQLAIYTDLKSTTYKRAQSYGGGYIQDPDNPNKLLTESQTKPELNIGLAYRTGEGKPWGFELILVYNVLNDASYYTGPFDFKVGVTYNF